MNRFFLLSILLCGILFAFVSCDSEPNVPQGAPTSLTEYEYYEDGITVKSITGLNADGSKTIREYDEIGILVRSTLYNVAGTVKAINEWDSHNNLTLVLSYNDDGTYNYVRYENSYDLAGNRIKTIGYNEDGSFRSIERFDANGNPTKTILYNSDNTLYYTSIREEDGTYKERFYNVYFPDGSTDVYDYDHNDILSSRTHYNSDGIKEFESEYTDGVETVIIYYNADGTVKGRSVLENGSWVNMPTSVINQDGRTEIYEYDQNWKRISLKVYNADGTIFSSTAYSSDGSYVFTDYYPSENKHYAYEYDKTGILIRHTCYLENGKVLETSEYGEQGTVVAKQVFYTYYEDGSIRSESLRLNGNEAKVVFYNADGTLRYICTSDAEGASVMKYYIVCNDDGSKDVYDYDADGYLEKLTSYNSVGTVSSWFVYGYDADRNLKTGTFYTPGDVLIYMDEYDLSRTKVSTTYYNSDKTVHYVYDCLTELSKYYNVYNNDGTKDVYEYDSDGAKINCYTSEGVLYKVIRKDVDGSDLSNVYLYYNSDDTVHYTVTYDSNGKETIRYYNVYNADGSKDLYEYDLLENLERHLHITYYDADTVCYLYEYDSDEKLVKKTYMNSDSTIGYISTYDSKGKENIRYYNEYKADGSKMIREYDAEDNLIKLTAYNSDSTCWYVRTYGSAQKFTDKYYNVYKSDGSKFYYEYDSEEKLVCITYYQSNGKLGFEENYYYDSDGFNYKVVTDYPSVKTIEKLYYSNDYLQKWTETYYDGRVETDEYEYDYSLDLQKRKHITTDEYGKITLWEEYEYNFLGNLTYKHYEFNAKGNLKTGYENEYDEYGRQVKCTVRNADGTYVAHAYNEIGVKTSETYYTADGVIEKVVNFSTLKDYTTVSYSYNADGTVKSVEESITVGNILKTITTYDADRKLVKEIFKNSDGTVWYTKDYDADGVATTRYYYNYSSDGTKDISEYDADGVLTRTTYYNADGTVNHKIIYHSDGTEEYVYE